ncbi:unnamed protein product (macronuclear) [Paramecium tetraurelia]|uniref:Fatty acid desaturase domain-containing protein n=1 Tax=Paramecium tetraurelia TaxID=5888 RepID=A0E0A3_PARTE|nr:uncharacterized protein GSPATT00021888001 [Paramecium tetraurelia]CAK88720.1 unnamed protein product [Paramecium tetraurelia]|eukprot:XP_001456117.1 hypothetical protein (macronuclear) [Paramecium tetraurelia strain d4-2]
MVERWTWLKGALCTIDRNYPLWIDDLHFEIGTTHVVHHVFSELPHYNTRFYYFVIIYRKQMSMQKLEIYIIKMPKNMDIPFNSASLVGVEHKGNRVWKFDKA